MVGSTVRVGFVGFLVIFLAVGCGGDDDESTDEATESGTCNSIAAIQQCTEVKGDAALIQEERDYCLEDGDTWSTDLCPIGADLIGCCHFEVDGDFLECYYTGYSDPDPGRTCVESIDGDWRPGSR